MFTRKALKEYIERFVHELMLKGYNPDKVILFGSYAYGKPNELSDIDLAVWDKKFIGCGAVDIEPIASLISKFPGIELHPFSLDDSENDNPFIREIIKRGQHISVGKNINA